MGYILCPKHGDDLYVNSWPRSASRENYELMQVQCCAGGVDAETALRIADVVEAKLAPMRGGMRMLADLTITARPKIPVVFSPEMNSEDIDANDLYSATYEWLIMFRDLCRSSGGFDVG